MIDLLANSAEAFYEGADLKSYIAALEIAIAHLTARVEALESAADDGG